MRPISSASSNLEQCIARIVRVTARASAAVISVSGATWLTTGRALFPGILASTVVAAAAAFLSQHYGAPVMLLALLLGMAMNFFSDVNRRIPCLIYINASARWLGLAW